MSFRKRTVERSAGPSRTPSGPSSPPSQPSTPTTTGPPRTPGVRPSPLDGRPTASTGTPSLDARLGGHAGLALGSLLLLEERGATDYAGTLLRLAAAEGVAQGHVVHVVGAPVTWPRELPGVVGAAAAEGEGERERRAAKGGEERMKIAYRYERLGQFGEGRRTGVATPPSSCFAYVDRMADWYNLVADL